MLDFVQYLFLFILFVSVIIYVLNTLKIIQIENLLLFYLILIGFFGYILTNLFSEYLVKRNSIQEEKSIKN